MNCPHNKLLQLSLMDIESASLPQGGRAVNGAAEPGRYVPRHQ